MRYEEAAESVIDRLLLALAAQCDGSANVGAAEAFADLSRAEAGVLFGQAGHLVHYGVGTEPLARLIDVIAVVQRSEAAADAELRPGDEVRLVGDLPANLADYDETWLRETVFVVRYVGTDTTVDVQPDLAEDYVIETVPAEIARPVRR